MEYKEALQAFSDIKKKHAISEFKRIKNKYLRTDADEENRERKEPGTTKGNHGNTRLPFGLCKKYGIEIQPEWTPKDAWAALAGKGVSAKEEYDKLEKKAKESSTLIDDFKKNIQKADSDKTAIGQIQDFIKEALKNNGDTLEYNDGAGDLSVKYKGNEEYSVFGFGIPYTLDSLKVAKLLVTDFYNDDDSVLDTIEIKSESGKAAGNEHPKTSEGKLTEEVSSLPPKIIYGTIDVNKFADDFMEEVLSSEEDAEFFEDLTEITEKLFDSVMKDPGDTINYNAKDGYKEITLQKVDKYGEKYFQISDKSPIISQSEAVDFLINELYVEEDGVNDPVDIMGDYLNTVGFAIKDIPGGKAIETADNPSKEATSKTVDGKTTITFKKSAYSANRKDGAVWIKGDSKYDNYKDSLKKFEHSSIGPSKLSAEKKEAIHKYTTSEHIKINKFLRTGTYFTDYKDTARKITEAIKGSVSDEDIWLQRGMDDDVAELLFGKDYKVGTEGQDKGFMSCGAAKNTGFYTNDIILNIYCPAGTEMKYIDPISFYHGENEMLLQRGTKLKITKIEKGDTQTFIDVEVISQEYDKI